MPCRALEAFRPAKTGTSATSSAIRLNALSGIGGVQTRGTTCRLRVDGNEVLMPCRALEAFRRI